MRDGIVRTYDVLALPRASRWGGTLVGTYVNERNAQYNLLDAIFSTTEDGVLSLATIRDADGEPCDFQIVHHNQGAAKLLKVSASSLQWSRLQDGANLLCGPEVIARLFDVVTHGNPDQFEINCDERNLRLAATAFGDVVSLTISDVTALKRRYASFRLLFDNNPMAMRAISGLGRSLNIATTAEGAETIDQLDWLRAEGCNEVQGFLFSAAKPAAEIEQLLFRFGARETRAA